MRSKTRVPEDYLDDDEDRAPKAARVRVPKATQSTPQGPCTASIAKFFEVTDLVDSAMRDAAAMAGTKVAEVTQAADSAMRDVVAAAGNQISWKARHVRFGEVETIEIENLKHETRALSIDPRFVECNNCERRFNKKDLIMATKLNYYCSCCYLKWHDLTSREAALGIVFPSGSPICHRLEDPLVVLSSETCAPSSETLLTTSSQTTLEETCEESCGDDRIAWQGESKQLSDHALALVYHNLLDLLEYDMLKVCMDKARPTLDMEVRI